ncbi:[FeFe] hydrogenase H-cluster maturation GTPase HydF [Garciella nitratireducens]|uniref:[FeFe] hydrogenase H-cluster maturation GTPase HydF n=1 Tax=Garciella nitratireducens DSM 15102 TaxID=1121911 RepID=A0A1T4KZ36_9FIRM|nr:[FeFe] hydrogenase H-cluster maturation GTPase HydF [Garciella nitratireducens]SJZ47580.1 [FeFe] hydrogenase H-cluster maturation GTPase HydF [Garciella nitratireducens DSM 15102]
MGLNSTPSSERLHIGLFGKRNAGKSSVINAITGQKLAIVSEQKGTTTDPVYKAMEILPIGPVVLIDTPGFDDQGQLGKQRIEKSIQVLNKVDMAILIIDGNLGISEDDYRWIEKFKEKNIPYLIVMNKLDLVKNADKKWENKLDFIIWVSTRTGENIHKLKEEIGKIAPFKEEMSRIIGDLIRPLDFVVLVVPIDKSAPKGRLILPQQQTIRDILDSNAISIVVKETEFKKVLQYLGKKPKLVITDSQVFEQVSKETPEDILLTSFSILFARYKGNLKEAVKGVKILDSLKEGDRILISEGCTHHRQCDDIGTIKLPRMIANYTGKQIQFEFSSGRDFPENLSKYAMVIHCGGCTLNKREMKYRIHCAQKQGVAITNYGILMAYINGILKRSIAPFPAIAKILQ